MPHKDPEALRQYKKKYLEKNRAVVNKKKREHYWANRARLLIEMRQATTVRRYGITRGQIQAMAQAQGGLCALCRKAPGGRGLQVDHDHESGKVRGLLCMPCNVALGALGDNQKGLMRALSYVSGLLESLEEE